MVEHNNYVVSLTSRKRSISANVLYMHVPFAIFVNTLRTLSSSSNISSKTKASDNQKTIRGLPSSVPKREISGSPSGAGSIFRLRMASAGVRKPFWRAHAKPPYTSS